MRRLILYFLLTSCTTAEFVRKDTSPTKQGVIRYPSNSSREEKYRNDLKKKVRDFCGGDYKITKEYQAREQVGSSGMGTGMGIGMGGIFLGGSNVSTEMFNFVEFTCQ